MTIKAHSNGRQAHLVAVALSNSNLVGARLTQSTFGGAELRLGCPWEAFAAAFPVALVRIEHSRRAHCTPGVSEHTPRSTVVHSDFNGALEIDRMATQVEMNLRPTRGTQCKPHFDYVFFVGIRLEREQ